MENNTNVKRYKVPQDVLMDILRILFRNNLRYKIEGIKEKENILILQVHFNDTSNHHNAQENIEYILEEYSKGMAGILTDVLLMDEEDQ